MGHRGTPHPAGTANYRTPPTGRRLSHREPALLYKRGPFGPVAHAALAQRRKKSVWSSGGRSIVSRLMKLHAFQITQYRSLYRPDPRWVTVEEVTCLVGKNEAGKTNLLRALERLNPADASRPPLNVVADFPRDRQGEALDAMEAGNPPKALTARFELTAAERVDFERCFGIAPSDLRAKCDIEADREPRSHVEVSLDYKENREWTFEADFEALVKKICADAGATPLEGVTTIENLETAAQENETLRVALDAAASRWGDEGWHEDAFWDATAAWCERHMPQFVYFDEYYELPSSTNMRTLAERVAVQGKLNDSDRTVLALLSEARIKPEEFTRETEFEAQQSKLEAAGTSITSTLFSYWTQNKDSKIVFHKSQPDAESEPDLAGGLNLHIGITDKRGVRVPFRQGSHGFRWFFSFLVYFTHFAKQTKNDGQDLVLLLDEPGTALHALAQENFLTVIEKQLRPQAQIIYSTHSPFLVDPARYDRVRLVEDRGDDGTIVDERVLYIQDRKTVFPLQAALGISIGQTLWVAPHVLLVEGPSDFLYLQVLKRAVAKHRPKSALDERAVLVPVDGIDKMPTFVRLFGANQLTIAAMIDSGTRSNKVKREMERIQDADGNLNMSADKIVTMGELTDQDEADIEDLFPIDFYVELVKAAGAGTAASILTTETVAQQGAVRITKRVEAAIEAAIPGMSVSHQTPAEYFHRMQDDYIDQVPEETLDRVAALFEKVNAALNLKITQHPLPDHPQ
jgi:energy-coupling factor transporter ATP-binding protein EcfA2